MPIFAIFDLVLSGKREGKIFQPRIYMVFKVYMLFSGEKLRKSENREKLPQTHKTKLRSRIFDLGPHSRAIGPQNREKSRF